ncbi:MAG: MFS transporter [Neomegalonema sp.]
MRALVAFAALFVSIALVQLGIGVLGPLDALAGAEAGVSTREIGLLGSAHFLGFFIGCIAAPVLVSRAGHSRAFATLTAIGVVSILLHAIWVDPIAWMIFRIGGGLTVAGSYTVVESWLQAKLQNSNRGRVLSTYRIVDMSGAVGSQLLLIQLDPGVYISYVVVAIIAVISLTPLSLTTAKPPPSPERPRLRPIRALKLSPLGALGVIVVGATSSSFRMVSPIYAAELPLSNPDPALLLAAAMLGGALAQPAAGWLADKFDRRYVLIWLSIAAIIVCFTLSTGEMTSHPTLLIIGSLIFGMATMPLYSVSVAHANDYCPEDFVVELNASLIFMFAVGAIISPTLAAELIVLYGPNALWLYISVAHIALILFGLYRMTRRPSPTARASYRWLPRTTMVIGRLFDRGDDTPTR